jgi:hypothetical protein
MARQGDVATTARRVTFRLLGADRERIDLVASFINDNHYGATSVLTFEGRHVLSVDIEMPLTEHMLCCVSSTITSVAAVFGLSYDGWEANIERLRA